MEAQESFGADVGMFNWVLRVNLRMFLVASLLGLLLSAIRFTIERGLLLPLGS